MKSISVKDVRLISALSHLSDFEVVHPDFDATVNPYLFEYGFDLSKGLFYTVSHHRRLDRSACTGFVITGEVRCDAAFRLSPFCSVEDRLIAAGKYDQSLARELAAMCNVAQSNYGVSFALDNEEEKELYQDQETIDKIEDELEALEAVLLNIRGNQHRRDGSLKRPQDYHFEEPREKERRKKKNRVSLKHREVA